MSRQTEVIRRRFTAKIRWGLMAMALMATTQMAIAGPTVEQLSNCLVKSTTAADKTTVLQWTFVALSAHPELKKFSNVNEAQRTQLDKNLAQV